MTHILIVEDEERIAGFIAKGLQRRGMTVTLAEDGAIALELLQQQDFDGILLDLGLPRVSGWEVMAELERHPQQTPVVIMTALSNEENAERALSMGAKAYMQKPFRFAELLQILDRHLN